MAGDLLSNSPDKLKKDHNGNGHGNGYSSKPDHRQPVRDFSLQDGHGNVSNLRRILLDYLEVYTLLHMCGVYCRLYVLL